MTRTTAAAALTLSLAGSALVAQEGPIRSLRSQDLAGAAGKEITMITVDYAPGASTPGASTSWASRGTLASIAPSRRQTSSTHT